MASYQRLNGGGQNMSCCAGLDPFDELVGFHHRNGSPPALAPDSTHSPLGLDPLAHLWQPDVGDTDLLGLSTPTARCPKVSGHQSGKPPLQDPWDIFDMPRPAQQSSQLSPQPATSHARGMPSTASTGDLLQLYDDECSVNAETARGHSPMTTQDRGMHGSVSTPEMSQANGNGQPVQGASNTSNGAASNPENRELFIYAIPLSKDKLVFLPITGWQEGSQPPPAGVAGSFQAGMSKIQESVSTMWSNMGNKDPSSLQHKIHAHGQAVMENMSAEERLMRYIPKAATKVIVYHPACIMPCEVQEQLQKMTSTFLVKATGKAAAAGLLLPVAVGIEMIAVPGTGWYALYQLYKSSVSVKGVNRLHQYLNHASNVRVCYAGMEKLDTYVERSKLSPDGLLTQDDVDDLCHELEEPGLQHPLTELRSRYLKRVQNKSGDYALVPANDADDSRSSQGSVVNHRRQSKSSVFQFWK